MEFFRKLMVAFFLGLLSENASKYIYTIILGGHIFASLWYFKSLSTAKESPYKEGGCRLFIQAEQNNALKLKFISKHHFIITLYNKTC